MRIFEINNKSRKIIHRLQKLYISYSIGVVNYNQLLLELNKKFVDPDIVREAEIIKLKLKKEIVELLRS